MPSIGRSFAQPPSTIRWRTAWLIGGDTDGNYTGAGVQGGGEKRASFSQCGTEGPGGGTLISTASSTSPFSSLPTARRYSRQTMASGPERGAAYWHPELVRKALGP